MSLQVWASEALLARVAERKLERELAREFMREATALGFEVMSEIEWSRRVHERQSDERLSRGRRRR